VGIFSVIFLWEGSLWFLLGFLMGVAENAVFFDGQFVVSLWWIDGGLW
jgi:hypothetical protein